MCKDFVYQGDDTWSEGTLYDPNNGSTYSGTIKMRDDKYLRHARLHWSRGYWTHGCMEAFKNAFKKEEVIHDALIF